MHKSLCRPHHKSLQVCCVFRQRPLAVHLQEYKILFHLSSITHSFAGQAHSSQLCLELILDELGDAGENCLEVVLHAHTSQTCQQAATAS